MLVTKYQNLKLVAALLISLFIGFDAHAMEDSEVQLYASFIQDLINSSSNVKSGPICTFGSDEISSAFLSQDSKTINLDKNPGKVAACKAIYVARGAEKMLKPEILKFNKNKILTVAIFDGFTEIDGMIQVQMGRRNFEITLNSKVAKASGVRLNALLLSLVIN